MTRRVRLAIAAITFGFVIWTTNHLVQQQTLVQDPVLPFASILGTATMKGRSASDHASDKHSSQTSHPLIAHEPEAFHFIVSGNTDDHLSAPIGHDGICRTLASGIVLNYPAPLTVKVDHAEEIAGEEEGALLKHRELQYLRSVIEVLERPKEIRDHDLVLVTHAAQSWFQLPPEVLVARYLGLVESRGARIVKSSKSSGKVKEFKETVIFAKSSDGPLTPTSTLSKGTGSISRELSSSLVIGPVRDLRAVFAAALDRLPSTFSPDGNFSTAVFQELYSEQQSSTKHISKRSNGSLLMDGSFDSNTRQIKTTHSEEKLSTEDAFANRVANDLVLYVVGLLSKQHPQKRDLTATTTSGRSLRMGIDTDGLLFGLAPLSKAVLYNPLQNPSYMSDLDDSRPPYPGPPFPNSTDPITRSLSFFVPLQPALDALPANVSWSHVPLFAPVGGLHIPALLSGPADPVAASVAWSALWYHAYSRALLRRALRGPRPFLWLGKGGEERSWDLSGGRGGAWSGEGWNGWKELCGGKEDGVFGDGKGVWGEEKGGEKGRVNYWGQVVVAGKVSGEKE